VKGLNLSGAGRTLKVMRTHWMWLEFQRGSRNSLPKRRTIRFCTISLPR
jgi:hypothetical protein